MSIIYRRSNYESEPNTPGLDSVVPTGEINHSYSCPHRETLKGLGWQQGQRYPTGHDLVDELLSTQYDACPNCGPYSLVTMWTHRVLCDRELNGPQDSDFYAVIWDDEAAQLRTITYATTRGGGGGHCKVDAPEWVKVKAQAWLERWARDEIEVGYWREAKKVAAEKRVAVVKGRKVPIGTTGVVDWIGMGQYRTERVRLRTDEGQEFWTAADNCEVVEPEQFVPSTNEMDNTARKWAKRRLWHRPFARHGFFQF